MNHSPPVRGIVTAIAVFVMALDASGAAHAARSAHARALAAGPRVPANFAAAAYGFPSLVEPYCTRLAKPVLGACFGVAGVRFRSAHAPTVGLRLSAFGRAGALTPLAATAPSIHGGRIRYAHGGLTEWWRALPAGYEQGFTLTRRPAGPGPLTLVLDASRVPRSLGAGLAWGPVRYGGLAVTDADGRTLAAQLVADGARILIRCDDSGARYPVTIDPIVWIAQKATASDGAADDEFGLSAAVSGDSALVGAPFAAVNGTPGQGAVYAFEKSNGAWIQTQRFSSTDGASGDRFGSALALDGSTAVIGAPGADVNGYLQEGAAYVFTQSGNVWTQRQKLLRNTDLAGSQFGYSVALSQGTALVGGYVLQQAAYVFTGSGGAWTQSAILTPSDGAPGDAFGTAVAVAGATALVGAPNAAIGGNAGQGAAYVFSNSGGLWNQNAKLIASDGAAGDAFASAVALAGDTAIAGAPHASVAGYGDNGAAYVFVASGGAWNQTQKLTPAGPTPGGLFGSAVALSGDALLVGAPSASTAQNSAQGAAFAFTSSNGAWMQTQELLAPDGAAADYFGSAVASDGTAALVGAPGATVNGNADQGAAYFHAQSDLALAMSVPATVQSGEQYASQTIVTNSSTSDSPAISLAIPVPTGTRYVSSTATQGSCGLQAATVTCALGSIPGDGGSATASVKLQATGASGDRIENTAAVTGATPPLSASAQTTVEGGGGGGGGSGGGGAMGPLVLALLALAALAQRSRRMRVCLRAKGAMPESAVTGRSVAAVLSNRTTSRRRRAPPREGFLSPREPRDS